MLSLRFIKTDKLKHRRKKIDKLLNSHAGVICCLGGSFWHVADLLRCTYDAFSKYDQGEVVAGLMRFYDVRRHETLYGE